jgi:hypothetical protein
VNANESSSFHDGAAASSSRNRATGCADSAIVWNRCRRKSTVTSASKRDIIRRRVVLVGYEGLVLDDGPTRLVVPLDDMQRVEGRKDRFRNGGLIGYGVGFATGRNDGFGDPANPIRLPSSTSVRRGPRLPLLSGASSGPDGFATGDITDAIKRKPHVVFDRGADRVAIAVAPALVRRGGRLR